MSGMSRGQLFYQSVILVRLVSVVVSTSVQLHIGCSPLIPAFLSGWPYLVTLAKAQAPRGDSLLGDIPWLLRLQEGFDLRIWTSMLRNRFATIPVVVGKRKKTTEDRKKESYTSYSASGQG